MSTRKFSNKQEKEIAKLFNAKVQPNSGAVAHHKGDVKLKSCLIDAKTSIKEVKSRTITQEELDKIKEESFAVKREFPVLVFNFGPNTENYFVFRQKDAKCLIENYEREYYE